MHRRRSGVVHVQLAAFQPIKLNHLLFLFFYSTSWRRVNLDKSSIHIGCFEWPVNLEVVTRIFWFKIPAAFCVNAAGV